MPLERVTRDNDDNGTSTVLCGRPDCDTAGRHFIEFEWNGWLGVIGSCEAHREDLDMLRIRSRQAEGRL